MTEQRWNPTLYDSHHDFVTGFGADLISLLKPQPGERILDLGCGTGHLTAQIQETGAEVTGMDMSPDMIAQAREAYPKLTFIEGNAADFHVDQPFDAVFSNATLHWIRTPERVIACVWEALKPGGRFVAEFGGRGNVAALVSSIYDTLKDTGYPVPEDTWYFPGAGEYATWLENQGFRVAYLAHYDRPTPLKGDDAIPHFLHMYVPHILESIAPDNRPAFIQGVEERLRPSCYSKGQWVFTFVRLCVVAFRLP